MAQQKQLYNIAALNLEPLSRWTASEMITYLYGESQLRQVSTYLKYSASDMETRLIEILHTDLLSTTPVQKMLGPLEIEKMHDKYIIPASAITQQCIDDKNKTITIPIHAFVGKSLIALQVSTHRYQTQDIEEPECIHYYLLLQSAKDPSILQPIKMMIGARTKELKINLCNKHLREDLGWELQVSHPGTLHKALQHYNNEPDVDHKGLSIPIQYIDTTMHGYDSTTIDPTQLAGYGQFSNIFNTLKLYSQQPMQGPDVFEYQQGYTQS